MFGFFFAQVWVIFSLFLPVKKMCLIFNGEKIPPIFCFLKSTENIKGLKKEKRCSLFRQKEECLLARSAPVKPPDSV
jgi:hypothetical protein